MTRWLRALLALTMLCRGGGASSARHPRPSAAPTADAGVGRVVADLGAVPYGITRSPDSATTGPTTPPSSCRGTGAICAVDDVRDAGHGGPGPRPRRVSARRSAGRRTPTPCVWHGERGRRRRHRLRVDAGPGQVSVLAADARVFDDDRASRATVVTCPSPGAPTPTRPRPWTPRATPATSTTGTSARQRAAVEARPARPALGWGPRGAPLRRRDGRSDLVRREEPGSASATRTACDDLDRARSYGSAWYRDGARGGGRGLGGGPNG